MSKSIKVTIAHARDPSKVVLQLDTPVSLEISVREFKQYLCSLSDTLSKLIIVYVTA